MTIRTNRFSQPELTSLLNLFSAGDGLVPVSSESYMICPAFCDVHVHFREPGFSYKETVRSGSQAGARGGYTAVCAMPNLNPVPDSPETLEREEEIIRRDAVIRVLPYGAITVGERGERIADLEGMAPRVCAFSDDGRGVQDRGLMREAMQRVRALGKILAAHCEDNSLLYGGCIHDGTYAHTHGYPGISAASEYRQVERDLVLADETGVAYHVCHVSTKESVELIRQAKKSGVNVTCETAPHYLVLDEGSLEEDGRFKMNPPLRGRDDRLALLAGLADGTVDMIATDHAPHSREEKAGGLRGSLFGIVGLETAFPVLYTHLVRTGILRMERLTELLSGAPRKRFGIPLAGEDYTVFDIGTPYGIDPERFASMGRSTPFAGWEVFGKCVATVTGGETVWQEDLTQN